ncbi:MAG TPA: amidohydrolase family protein [Chloroflexota bacterium]
MDITYGLISVDDHVLEHPRVWEDRLSKSTWGDRIPHVEQSNGIERWVVDGHPLPLTGRGSIGALLPDRAASPAHWSEVPPQAYDPAERLKAMDADRVDVSVLYPTVAGMAGETFGQLEDAELELACVQAYNDWLLEEWASASPRFVPQCVAPLAPVEASVAEIRRAVGKGHRGVVFPATPMLQRDLPHINELTYDPIWAVCEELHVPVCFHSGSSSRLEFPLYPELAPSLQAALSVVNRPLAAISVFSNILYSHILVRHPKLKVIFADSSLGWGAYELELADHEFERQRLHLDNGEVRPSELFRRQCYLTGCFDRAGIDLRAYIGLDNILWETNFPQASSPWPRSWDAIETSFSSVPSEERQQLLMGNAQRVYGL